MAGAAADAGRGRGAERPSEIGRPGWRDIGLRVWGEIGDDHISVVAAGIAFYTLLALFPGIAVVISIWGLVSDPQQIEQQITAASSFLPGGAADIIKDQAQKVASSTGGASLAAIGGILFAIYSASKGMKALIDGLNIVYDEDEKRGFLKLNLMALGLTLFLIVGLVIAFALVAVAPALISTLGLGGTVQALVTWLRWPILFLGALITLAMLYRYAPSRDEPRWRWVSWGAVIATVLWLIGSAAFSVYVRNFGSYNATYGSLGAVIILLMWLWLSAFIVLLGAEVNAEMEHQTAEDTTKGQPQPKGERGAHMADTVGETP